MIKKKIVHPTERFSGSTDENLNLRVGLERDEQLLREGDRNIILDINELFKKDSYLLDIKGIFKKSQSQFRL